MSSSSRRGFIAAVVGPLAAACGVSLSPHESAKALSRQSMFGSTPQSSVDPLGSRSGVLSGTTMVYENGQLVDQYSWTDHGFGRQRC